jgi:hypothetical protein
MRETIPTCEGERECAAKWDAAQLHVVKNSGFKIQLVTNVLISTYNSVGGSTALAWRITKEPVGGGRTRIVAMAYCGNMFGCDVDPVEAIIAFNNAVSRVAP